MQSHTDVAEVRRSAVWGSRSGCARASRNSSLARLSADSQQPRERCACSPEASACVRLSARADQAGWLVVRGGDGGDASGCRMPVSWERDLGEACVVDRGSPNVERSDLNLEAAQEAIASFPVAEVHDPPPKNTSRCNVPSESMYKHLYWRSLADADNFWKEVTLSQGRAVDKLRWSHLFTKTQHGSLQSGDVCWFLNGKLNACDNCVDRWAEQYPQRIALICEGDNPEDTQVVTYKELQDQVCRFANLLKSLDVRKGDIVTIYLPMMAEIVYAMLACARIGAVHSTTSRETEEEASPFLLQREKQTEEEADVQLLPLLPAHSLAERLEDANSKVLITTTKSTRGGKVVHLKAVVNEALELCSCVKHVVLFRRSEDPSCFVEGRDLSGDDLLPQMRPYCPLEIMDSEDVLFILYTSGSTGKPKGVCHTTAGYLLYTALTHEYIFDYHPGDTFGCLADCGWITGHSYTVYGALCNGATTVLFQGIPTYPTPGRYWELVQKWKVTQLYTSPTAIRALMMHGDEWPKKYDLSTLRVIGSVGEPINPEAWRWVFNNIGRGQCSVVDTYWQTETGGHVLSPFPGATITKPGCAMVPFFGIEPAIVDPQTGEEKKGNGVCGVLCLKRSWPGVCRTVHRAHKRLVNTYYQPYPGYYFTGDGAYRDIDGHYWITGRVDDTLNVSGHRLSTAEIEHALVQHPAIVEAAVVGVPHDVKGTAIFCFVILKEGIREEGIAAGAKAQVRKEIGPIATPDFIVIVPGLPKTQSGKIMRRLLRKLCCLDTNLGDTTSLANAEILQVLKPLVMDAVITERSKFSAIAGSNADRGGKRAKQDDRCAHPQVPLQMMKTTRAALDEQQLRMLQQNRSVHADMAGPAFPPPPAAAAKRHADRGCLVGGGEETQQQRFDWGICICMCVRLRLQSSLFVSDAALLAGWRRARHRQAATLLAFLNLSLLTSFHPHLMPHCLCMQRSNALAGVLLTYPLPAQKHIHSSSRSCNARGT
ncbi:hypothetical protein Efla_006733 [Eimeria flavescens]